VCVFVCLCVLACVRVYAYSGMPDVFCLLLSTLVHSDPECITHDFQQCYKIQQAHAVVNISSVWYTARKNATIFSNIIIDVIPFRHYTRYITFNMYSSDLGKIFFKCIWNKYFKYFIKIVFRINYDTYF